MRRHQSVPYTPLWRVVPLLAMLLAAPPSPTNTQPTYVDQPIPAPDTTGYTNFIQPHWFDDFMFAAAFCYILAVLLCNWGGGEMFGFALIPIAGTIVFTLAAWGCHTFLATLMAGLHFALVMAIIWHLPYNLFLKRKRGH